MGTFLWISRPGTDRLRPPVRQPPPAGTGRPPAPARRRPRRTGRPARPTPSRRQSPSATAGPSPPAGDVVGVRLLVGVVPAEHLELEPRRDQTDARPGDAEE